MEANNIKRFCSLWMRYRHLLLIAIVVGYMAAHHSYGLENLITLITTATP